MKVSNVIGFKLIKENLISINEIQKDINEKQLVNADFINTLDWAMLETKRRAYMEINDLYVELFGLSEEIKVIEYKSILE